MYSGFLLLIVVFLHFSAKWAINEFSQREAQILIKGSSLVHIYISNQSSITLLGKYLIFVLNTRA